MSDQDEGGRVPLRGDEAELFRDFNGQFVRLVRSRTNAPREIVDDACAFAWQQFMRHQPDRDRNWRGWLITTAEREAWRLREIEAGHLSLSVGDGPDSAVWDVPERRGQLAIRTQLREALSALAEVPARRREIKALQITGFSYEEICEIRGLTYMRVNRMIAEANAVLREEQGREAASRSHVSPRAARLSELEERPPKWLRSATGRRPGVSSSDPWAVRPGGARHSRSTTTGASTVEGSATSRSANGRMIPKRLEPSISPAPRCGGRSSLGSACAGPAWSDDPG